MANMRTAVQSHSLARTGNELPGAAHEATGVTCADPIFHESLAHCLRRWALGAAYALRPNRIALMPRLTLMSIARLFAPAGERDKLPDHPVYYSSRGLVGISNDLSVDALLANYKRGYFPVCHIGAMKWWCPDERAVIDPALTHVGKNLRRLLRQGKFTLTMDQDFAGVIEACAAPRPGKAPLTWITPRVMRAYWEAHKAGYAHSVEVWDEEARLVGGLYGLAIGKVFFGESQFSASEHASKVALVALHRQLAAWGYHLRDGKWMTPHLASFGFRAMPRDDFKILLDWYVDEPQEVGPWRLDPDLDLADWVHKESPATNGAAPRASLKVA
jgi:leucyl/phenylalanyl-tRNA---protein transferase